MGESHLSIGEVLTLLQSEFPDVTISKIRFLESQGLLVPERTPSGYRKFRQSDIDQLRWILTQQRDHFLPLRVIKERIDSGNLISGPADGVLPFSDPEPTEPPPPTTTGGAGRAAATNDLMEGPPPGPKKGHPTRQGGAAPRRAPAAAMDDRTALTRAELAQLSGLDVEAVDELEKYGLLASVLLGDVPCFDEDDLVVARLAAGFGRYGIEPRHLRMYKVSAEREAGLFEQLIMPLLKQRRAAARDEAVEMLEELAELADDLRAVMVRSALRGYLGTA
ncbi:MAG: MerR family transcriptional regulator [Acidimicrobiia bacterium]|nr:MerR family transcriptional regulator [Acidimicrobiia bacterium]